MDWPKMGPSLLIGSCLILAIRTAKWAIRDPKSTASDQPLEQEIQHAIHLASRVLSALTVSHASLFPQRQEPRFVPNDDDLQE